jgi:DNA-binding response OmpR family regulator
MPRPTTFSARCRRPASVVWCWTFTWITAHDDLATRKRIRESGAAGFLVKPFDPQALLDAIHRVAGSA